MPKGAEPNIMFKHLRTMERSRQPPAVCNAGNFTLEQVASYNIHIDTGNTKTVTLHEVPGFLIEAFSKFQQLEGCKVEGVFRKEGNSLRLKEDPMPVFFGAQMIPPNFLVHDVCSWIKKFFRELRQPLFVTREQKLMQFAESLNGDLLFGALISLLDRLPPSHMGTLGYLMRCLQEISESAHVHQMTVENLATVFAPSLFRGIPEKEPKKKRNGSQDDLLRVLKRNNDLLVKVVKVLIENAGKIGAATDCYRAARSASDAKIKERKLISTSVQRNAAAAAKPPTGGAYMKINSALLKKNSRSTTNLASEPSTSSLLSQRNSDDDTLNSPRKAKQRRSNSVVRMAFKSFKKSFTNLTSDAFMSTPDPPGLANKKIPKPAYHQQTPIKQSVSMDPSTTTSSDDTLSDFSRRKHPEYVGVNIQEIRKVMSPKDLKKRPPIPNFDNRSSSTDEKKENEHEDENTTKKSTILRKRSSSGSKKPMGVSNATNIHRAATQMMHRREQPVKVDRSRRSTAPVKTSIKRMQPVSRTSGLTLLQKSRPFQRRRSSSRRSGSNTSTSSSDSQSPNTTQDILEQKGADARRRRRMKKKDNSESLTNVYNSSSVIEPSSPMKVQNSISPVFSFNAKTEKPEPTSDLPLTSDVSSPELQRAVPAFVSPCDPKSSLVSLITKKKATTPPLSVDVNVTPQREPLPLVTPSPDSGCSLASSSKQQQTNSDHIFVVPELPKRFIRPAQVDIKPSGTSIYFHTESSRAKQKSPVHKSPLPHSRRSSSATSSRTSSKSPARRPRPQVIPSSPSDHKCFDFNSINDEKFDGDEKHLILNSTSNDDCNFPEVGRPSIAQIQGTGVVSRRIQQYKKLSNNTSKFPTTRGISGNESNFAKPMGKPASHGLLWKRTNVNDAIPEQPTKSQNFGSSRAKSVTSIYSTRRTCLDSVRPSVSATSQIPSSRIKKVECGTTISRYPN